MGISLAPCRVSSENGSQTKQAKSSSRVERTVCVGRTDLREELATFSHNHPLPGAPGHNGVSRSVMQLQMASTCQAWLDPHNDV
jgi:hypothetical protein